MKLIASVAMYLDLIAQDIYRSWCCPSSMMQARKNFPKTIILGTSGYRNHQMLVARIEGTDCSLVFIVKTTRRSCIGSSEYRYPGCGSEAGNLNFNFTFNLSLS